MKNNNNLIYKILCLGFLLGGFLVSPIQAEDCILDTDGDGLADGTDGASSSSDSANLACGTSASAGSFSTAIGSSASANGNSTVAMGTSASATGGFSVAVGREASSAGSASVAVGVAASSGASNSTALGRSAAANSSAATSVGFGAGFNGGTEVTDSPHAIAIGYLANIDAASPGAIAIGGDSADLSDKGASASGENAIAIGADAQATAPGAIAIGTNVVADTADTLVTNVPILAKNISDIVFARTMFEIQNPGNTKFSVTNSDANESWAFANPGTGFRLSRQGSGSVEFEVKNNGNAVLAGTLTENSDRNAKQDIQLLDQQTILDKVMELPISEWRYKDDPASRHIGPMAQDFYQAFKLGSTDKGISTLDSSGIALAAIQALKAENETMRVTKDQQIAQLNQKLLQLEMKLNQLEIQ